MGLQVIFLFGSILNPSSWVPSVTFPLEKRLCTIHQIRTPNWNIDRYLEMSRTIKSHMWLLGYNLFNIIEKIVGIGNANDMIQNIVIVKLEKKKNLIVSYVQCGLIAQVFETIKQMDVQIITWMKAKTNLYFLFQNTVMTESKAAIIKKLQELWQE